MASIKVKFRPSVISDHEGVIYYQIIHSRKVRQIHTQWRVYRSEWDESRSMVVDSGNVGRREYLRELRESVRNDVERLACIVRRFEYGVGEYTADDVVEMFTYYANEYSLFRYMERIIVQLKENGRTRTAETYKATLNSFREFRRGQDVMLDCIDSELMEKFQAWHKCRGNTPNTVSFYMRILRAVYNRAVERDVIENRHPFRHVYTGIYRTIKRALPLGVIRKINALDLSPEPRLDFARDMFMLSFMLRGMSFIDMAFLRKSDLSNGFVVYRRRKTGQRLEIKWTKEMQMILDKYPDNRTDYLLPIISSSEVNEQYRYKNVGYNINHNLKLVAERVGIHIPLTLYVARHSWATAARSKRIPLSVISEGLGHENEATTRIYLANLETSVVDKANSLILKSLL